MRILTADIRFSSVFRQEFTDFIDRRVHPAFHIAGVVVSAVVINSFIMNKTGRVHLPVQLGHFKNNFSAKRFISAGPDQNRRMVFVSLIHRIHTVEHAVHPLRAVAWYNTGEISVSYRIRISRSMGLHVALRDHVKTVFIAQIINADRIRVMAGTDCIDVVLFHRCQVFDQLFSRNNTAGYGAELVAVDAFKDNAFSIQHHDVVFHLKAAESDSLRNQFLHRSILCGDFQQKIIQHRCLCGPQFRVIDFQNKLCFPIQHTFGALQCRSVF